MKDVIIDGLKIKDKKKLHKVLKKKLELPDYYGNNLDALVDCLTEPEYAANISVINSAALLENLEKYGERFLKVLDYISEENENIKIKIESQDPSN